MLIGPVLFRRANRLELTLPQVESNLVDNTWGDRRRGDRAGQKKTNMLFLPGL